ncbi:HET-domain-containing protein, partial [Setomelanomma holmii]
MRLLNVGTFTLKSFFEDVPAYAILSHCWDEEEVVFSDLTDLDAARAKKGYDKIEKTCAQAAKDGFEYCWIDTCCIDKSSSAELSEAINSMFAWYRNSGKCYAYLADVQTPEDFANSKWFTRAWTLQELLAPSHIETETLRNGTRSGSNTGMEFFSQDWTRLGSKGGLSVTLSKITSVPKEYLERVSPENASISMRMSWAADRHATRAEDVAYSLLGIFDVNMPLLYGEGKVK